MKKVRCAALVLFIVFLSACQPTPDTAVVAEKNAELEKLILKPAASDSVLQALPESWQEETSFTNGVSLVVNAKLEIPDVQACPVVEAVPHEISLDEAKGYVSIIMQGQPVYELGDLRIKSDWNEDILRAEAEIESVKNDESLNEDIRQQTLDGLNGQLDYLKQRRESAPEERPEPIPASMTFVRQSDTQQTLAVQADLGQKSPAQLSIFNSDDNLNNGVMFYDGSGDSFSVPLSTEPAAGMVMPRDEAQQKAEDFLESLGIADMRLAYTDFNADPGNGLKIDFSVLANDPKIKKCYVFNYTPVVGGIPVTANRFYYGSSSTTETYDKVWHDETILVYVNENGVYRMDWYSPDDLGQILNANVALLDFSEVKQVFSKQMFYQKTWNIPGTEDTAITIKTVKLGMMRVRLQENRYVYQPVWDFIGDWTYNMEGIPDGMHNVSLMTVNAIDGSVIDRGVGY